MYAQAQHSRPPTPPQWACLEDVMADRLGVVALHNFLIKEYCEENLVFLRSVEAFRSIEDHEGKFPAGSGCVS